MVDPEDHLCYATAEGQGSFNTLHEAFADNNSERYIKEQIQGTGLDYVGQGDGRIVLLDRAGQFLHSKNACVVKINKYGENENNETEILNWEKLKDELGHRLNTITDYDDDYRWLVQPYIDTEVTEEMLIELEKEFIEKGWKVKDVNKRNCARVQDRAVMIDYDQFIRQIDLEVMDRQERNRLIDWKYED